MLAVAVLGLVFIGLVSVAGFTVMAQRRLRALGMLAALGATERNVRLVMTANGAAVGLTATWSAWRRGSAAWFAYVPSLEADTAHRIDPLNLPWWAIVAGMVLAVVTSVLAAAGGPPGPWPGSRCWRPCPGARPRRRPCDAPPCRAWPAHRRRVLPRCSPAAGAAERRRACSSSAAWPRSAAGISLLAPCASSC